MFKKKFIKFLFLLFFVLISFLPVKIYAQTTNVGFVPTNIWYSKDPFEQGDKIKIYTLIFNPDTRQLSGTVDFFDNSTLLGTKDFKISGTTAQDIYISWTVTVGSHSIFGQIENAKFLNSNGAYEVVSLAENKTETSSRTVAEKIIPATSDSGSSQIGQAVDKVVNSIQNIGQTVENKIPTSITKPVTTATNSVENLRNTLGVNITQSKLAAKQAVAVLNSTEPMLKNAIEVSYIQKPFAYVKLFFFTVLDFIFSHRVIFYGILILIAFLILRFIWNLVF
jgi:hypothetical protein